MAADGELLFVYGTLREALAHPMAKVLGTHATGIGRATFRGRLFDLGDYPGAVSSHDASDRVAGELYRIAPGREAALFAELDRYEDYNPDDPSAGEYRRVRAQVQPESGDPVEAWIYLYNRPTAHLSRIVPGDYAGHRRRARKTN